MSAPHSFPTRRSSDLTTEQVNQEIKAYLSIYCASHPEDWPQALHTLEFTHNNQRHADRQNTPFELMFRESLVVIPLAFESTKYLTILMADKSNQTARDSNTLHVVVVRMFP